MACKAWGHRFESCCRKKVTRAIYWPDFQAKIFWKYNLLSYSFETCAKQKKENYKVPVKIWWRYLSPFLRYSHLISLALTLLILCLCFELLIPYRRWQYCTSTLLHEYVGNLFLPSFFRSANENVEIVDVCIWKYEMHRIILITKADRNSRITTI